MDFIYAFSFIQERNKVSGNNLKRIRLSVETKKNKKERLSVVAALDSLS